MNAARSCAGATAQVRPVPTVPTRRSLLLAVPAGLLFFGRPQQSLAAVLEPLVIDIEKTPDQRKYDPNDKNLRDAANLLQEALNATNVEEEERLWGKIIDKYSSSTADWMPDIVGRAYGNRGNARSRQGKFDSALSDYDTAIRLCPWSPDPVLNRGVAYEALDRLEESERDYRAVLKANPQDPAGYNNLGNVFLRRGDYEQSLQMYTQAVQLSPQFAFAAASRAEVLYQLGDSKNAFREMRTLLRRYPDFDEVRASLAAALWNEGLEAEAEANWSRVTDPRYKDRAWLRDRRRWPPKLLTGIDAFLRVKSV